MANGPSSDPDAPVIEWQTSGGLADVGDGGPDLLVRADGRVEVAERFGGGRRVLGRIPVERLHELLRSVIEAHRFFEIDAAALGDAVAAARPAREEGGYGGDDQGVAIPLGPPYADAGTTRIVVSADGRRHEVAYHGLSAAAREHPDVRGLADLRAVERRLLELAEEVGRRG